uniref:Uncharacterized protein n=1 Tax=Arundo donax TaxID=35708 RepID=A0A0A9GFD2_ARUDO
MPLLNFMEKLDRGGAVEPGDAGPPNTSPQSPAPPPRLGDDASLPGNMSL